MSRAASAPTPARAAVVAVAVGAVAATAARAAYAGLRRRPPAGEQTWTRTNHRGEPLTLLEGPAAAVGAIAAELIAAGAFRSSRPARDPAHDLALAGAGALACGLIDDLKGSGQRRGLRGHLGALTHGEVTTGTVKLAGLAVTGLATAAWAATASTRVDMVINAGLIAGGANLLNLFDLRPGRAIKVAALAGGLIATVSAVTGGPATGRPAGPASPAHSAGRSAGLAAVAAPLGASLALLPEDLGERAMLGDAGANALGAMLGAAAARSLPRPARIGLLAGIIALTGISEKVSFTALIERTPWLHRLDMLGRGPAPGRHRRDGSADGRVRSGQWTFALFAKTPARQER